MPLDPSIPLAARGPDNLMMPAQAAQGVLTAQILRQRAAAQQMELTSAQQDEAENAQIRRIFQSTEGDVPRALDAIRQVNPLKAIKIQSAFDESQKTAHEIRLKQLEMADTINEHAMRQLARMDPADPSSWESVTSSMKSIYQTAGLPAPPELDGPPPDAARLEQMKRASLSVKEQFAVEQQRIMDAISQKREDRALADADRREADRVADNARQADQFKETQRHNVATERHGMAMEARLGAAVAAASHAAVAPNATLEDLARGSGLTPAALRNAAEQLHRGQQPTGFGMGGKTVMVAIRNAEALLYGDDNLSGAAAGYKADAASLKNVQQTLDTIQGFHRAAVSNLQLFGDLAKQIPDTRSPFFNTPIRSLNEKIFGSEQVAAARTAKSVALREVARITGNPRLTGELSDTSRREVADLIPDGATLNQINRVVKVLEADLNNVERGQQEQLAVIQGRLGADTPVPPTKKRFTILSVK